MHDSPRTLRRREASAFLCERGYPNAPSTLAKLASVGGGPVFQSFGRIPLYREDDLLAWAQSRSTGPRRSTSDPGTKSGQRLALLGVASPASAASHEASQTSK